jgi:hypothetical protein
MKSTAGSKEEAMKVISSTTLSRYGNDVYIDEEVLLVEQFGIYAVLRFYKVSGWSDQEEVSVLITTSDKAEAGKKYKEYCKFYKS